MATASQTYRWREPDLPARRGGRGREGLPASRRDFALRVETRGATGYTAVQLTGAAVRSQVLAMRGKYDGVVIDASGRDTTGLRAALTIADVAVVPFQPRAFDVNCANPQGEDNRSAAEAGSCRLQPSAFLTRSAR